MKTAKLYLNSVLLWFQYHKRDIFGVLFVVAILGPVVVYYSFDVPDSQGVELSGKVIQRGVQTATYHELPGLVVKVRLESGDLVEVGVPNQQMVELGDTVILSKTESVLTGGKLYEFRGIREQ